MHCLNFKISLQLKKKPESEHENKKLPFQNLEATVKNTIM